MLVKTFLVSSAGGGSSKFDGVVQKGLRIFRKVFQGEKTKVPGSGNVEAEQSLVKFQQAQHANFYKSPSVGVSAVKNGARNILANYLARNNFQTLAAEMRSRYAFRLMSGSARFYTGVGNRVALYGFVGISFAGLVQNPTTVTPDYNKESKVLETLFITGKEVEPVTSDDLQLEDSVLPVADVEVDNTRDESDIEILSEAESGDFEVIDDDEALSLNLELAGQDLESLTNDQLCRVIRSMDRECVELEKKHLEEVSILQNSLKRVLIEADVLQEQLIMLRDTVIRQNSLLNIFVVNLDASNPRKSGDSRGLRQLKKPNESSMHEINCRKIQGDDSRVADETERSGICVGRAKSLKMHRKKRLKVL